MTKELIVIRGVIASLPEQQRAQIKESAEKIREAIKEFPKECGIFALALVALEAAE